MKYIKKYNEAQSHFTDEDMKLDKENIEELEDLFITLQDLEIENFKISNIPNFKTKKYQQRYDITWYYDFNFYFDNYKRDGLYLDKGDKGESMENLNEFKQKVETFNKIQSEIVEILERVITMGYNVLSYKMDVEKGEPLHFELSIER